MPSCPIFDFSFTKKTIKFGVSDLTCGKSGVVALLVTLTVVPDVAEDGAEDEMLKAETDEVGGGGCCCCCCDSCAKTGAEDAAVVTGTEVAAEAATGVVVEGGIVGAPGSAFLPCWSCLRSRAFAPPGMVAAAVAAGKGQVWSITQFYSIDFSQSRIIIKKCVFNKHTIKVCVCCC